LAAAAVSESLHPTAIKPDRAEQLLQEAVQAAPQNREHVRKVEGLAAHRNPI
jgi:hypothetical protein